MGSRFHITHPTMPMLSHPTNNAHVVPPNHRDVPPHSARRSGIGQAAGTKEQDQFLSKRCPDIHRLLAKE